MKRLFQALPLVLLLPALALAQPMISVVRNDSGTTTLQAKNLYPSSIAVTDTGKVFVTSGTGATDIAKAIGGTPGATDTGVVGLFKTLTAMAAGTNAQYQPGVVNAANQALYVDPVSQSVATTTALTVTAGAYASVNLIVGGLQTLTNAVRAGANSLTLKGVTVSDLAALGKNMSMVVFSANPSGTTFTDGIALDIADADIPKVAHVIPLATHKAFADNGTTVSGDIERVVDLGSGTSLYYTLITDEAQTPTSTTDKQVTIFYNQH